MPPAPSAEPRPTVLVLEDEEAVRDYVRTVLEMSGYAVLPAAGADEAERLFRSDPARVALVLTDVLMPGRTGPELARDLWAVRPGLDVLFMSGYVGGPQALPAGAVVLEKPFCPTALLTAVRRAC